MARPVFSSNPSFGLLEQTVSTPLQSPLLPEIHLPPDKPLPPTPRRPSSAYTALPDEPEPHYYERTRFDQYFSNETLQPKVYSASAVGVRDPIPIRPKLLRDVQGHGASEPIVEKRRAEQSLYGDTRELASPWAAKEHAEYYESVLHSRSSNLPSITPDPFFPDHGDPSSTLSPRITDVVDHSLLPSPLRFSDATYDEPTSYFSSDSSSDGGSCKSGIRGSMKSYAKKKLSKRKDTLDAAETTRLTSPQKPKSRLGSTVSQQRASKQRGVEDMYDTLNSLSLSPGRPKTPAMEFEKIHIARERRSPAIPLTQYQMIGAKAFEDTASTKSSKSSFLLSRSSKESKRRPDTPTRTKKTSNEYAGKYFALPEDTSPKRLPLSKKLAAAFSSGTTQLESAMGLNTNRVKRSRSDKKRAELKKKITIVGLGDGQLAGGGRWM